MLDWAPICFTQSFAAWTARFAAPRPEVTKFRKAAAAAKALKVKYKPQQQHL